MLDLPRTTPGSHCPAPIPVGRRMPQHFSADASQIQRMGQRIDQNRDRRKSLTFHGTGVVYQKTDNTIALALGSGLHEYLMVFGIADQLRKSSRINQTFILTKQPTVVGRISKELFQFACKSRHTDRLRGHQFVQIKAQSLSFVIAKQ